MDARAKPPQWRASESAYQRGRWILEQNIGGIWNALGESATGEPITFTEEDAKLLAGGPVLLTKLVGMDVMLSRLRQTMASTTSMRHVREAGADKALQAFVDDVRKTIAEMGGPKDQNNGGRA